MPSKRDADRSRIELDLRVSEERLHAIFNSEPECVKVVDLSGRVLDMNAAGVAMLEAASIEDVRGESIARWVHPEDLPAAIGLFERAAAGYSAAATFRVITLKGHERLAESHASPLRAGTEAVTAVLTVTHDITDRRRATEERDLYAQAMRYMNVGLVVARLEDDGPAPTFRFAAANDAALRLIGVKERELVGRTVTECFPRLAHPGVMAKAIDALKTRRSQHLGDVSYADDRFPLRVFNVAIAPISDRVLAATFQDVTEQRHLEDQFRHAQKMEALGRVAGGVAHDFNNLLTVIIGYLQAVRMAPEMPAPLLGDMDEAVAAADRAARLTRQLLAFSRRQVLQPRVLLIDALLRELSPMLKMIVREDIDLRIDLGAFDSRVKVDPGQLEQVVVNLVVNASDAMPSGGTLIIRTTAIPATGDSDRGWVQLTVADTGVGMDEAILARVFEPFFTTKGEAGTGLGLATVYGIVKQSGGRVTCESKPGGGSSFYVDLPLVSEAAESMVARAPRQAGRGGESLLVVEDHEAVRRMIAVTLERAGYKVATAATGDEALALARAGHEFDVVITDMVMPGMTGRQVADAIRQMTPRTEIIFVSGYVDDPTPSLSFAHFVPKPFLPATLAAKIREVLDSRAHLH
jgi:two-component system cell cycle sensor histidine kinase/response regulator CckA